LVELVINLRTAVRPPRSCALREVLSAMLSGLILVGALQGCSVSPAEQEAIRQAWQEKDAERAAECRRAGRGFVAGGCTGGGGP
jgi:hypothetical protein